MWINKWKKKTYKKVLQRNMRKKLASALEVFYITSYFNNNKHLNYLLLNVANFSYSKML